MMKKIFALMLALSLLFCGAGWAEEAEETPVDPENVELGENDILVHGYISPYSNYYVAVPHDWALVGAGSTPENIAQACEMIDESVSELISQLSAENDILFAVGPNGEGLVLTYGNATGATSIDLVNSTETFKKELAASFPGIRFADDCGAYKLSDIAEVLLISANYNGQNIRQYYLASGTTLYIFTFTGVSEQIARAVLSLFHV